jgi:hypothetical protein
METHPWGVAEVQADEDSGEWEVTQVKDDVHAGTFGWPSLLG